MRIVHYSQHVLGVGHFFRSLEIDRALASHDVHLVTGGADPGVALPGHVVHHKLPPLMMDERFGRLIPQGAWAGRDPDEVLDERRGRLLALMAELRPDLLLVELFPFGRKRFGFELLPVLEALRTGDFGPCKAVCSLRDILVEKDDRAKYEDRVVRQMNAFFDLLLVHTDPAVVRLEETFARVADLAVPVTDTGYVTPRPEPGAGARLRERLCLGTGGRLIVASAGGGSVGWELLEAAILASLELTETTPHRLQVFAGPFMPAQRLAALFDAADDAEHIDIERFTDEFPAWLDAADLSVSMAGYNTTMNLLACGTYGLVLPFARNREQSMRAGRLAARGALGVLDEADLAPDRLARRLATGLGWRARSACCDGACSAEASSPHPVDLDGAAATAAALEALARGDSDALARGGFSPRRQGGRA